MDRRIIFDYFRRYGAAFAFTAIFYAGLGVFQTMRYGDNALILLAYLSLVLCAWYFISDLHQHRVARMVRTLPVEKSAHGRALLFEAVAVPIIVGGSVIALGVPAIYKYVPDKLTFMGNIPPYICFVLLLCSGLFLFLSVFRWWEIGPFLSAVYGLAFLAYGIGCLYLTRHWDDSQVVRVLAVLATLAMTVGSYRFAPRFLESLSGNRVTPKEPAIVPTRDLRGQDTAIHWLDTCTANPFTFVMLGSLSLVVLVGVAYGLVHWLSGTIEGLLSPTLFLFFAVQLVIVAFVVLAWSFLGSIRVYASLPVTRNRLVIGCLALPFIAFLPIAVSTLFGTRIFLVAYIVGVGACLTANAFYFQLNKMAALVSINSILVLLGFWPLLRMGAMHAGQLESAAFVDSVGISLALVAIVISAVWTGWMLCYSNAPFRKKATLALERFGGA